MVVLVLEATTTAPAGSVPVAATVAATIAVPVLAGSKPVTDALTVASTGNGAAAETGVQEPDAGGVPVTVQIEKELVPGGCAPERWVLAKQDAPMTGAAAVGV